MPEVAKSQPRASVEVRLLCSLPSRTFVAAHAALLLTLYPTFRACSVQLQECWHVRLDQQQHPPAIVRVVSWWRAAVAASAAGAVAAAAAAAAAVLASLRAAHWPSSMKCSASCWTSAGQGRQGYVITGSTAITVGVSCRHALYPALGPHYTATLHGSMSSSVGWLNSSDWWTDEGAGARAGRQAGMWVGDCSQRRIGIAHTGTANKNHTCVICGQMHC